MRIPRLAARPKRKIVAAIEAAAHPAHVNYLYYVAVPGQDAQYFTASYADFKAHGG